MREERQEGGREERGEGGWRDVRKEGDDRGRLLMEGRHSPPHPLH